MSKERIYERLLQEVIDECGTDDVSNISGKLFCRIQDALEDSEDEEVTWKSEVSADLSSAINVLSNEVAEFASTADSSNNFQRLHDLSSFLLTLSHLKDAIGRYEDTFQE